MVELSELPRSRVGGSVFVSYSRMDRVLVGRLVEQLRMKGIVTRWDGDIAGGDDFQETIGEWIEDAALVVVLLTEHSVASSRVKDEVSLARHYSCHRLPLRVGDVRLPPGLHLDLVRTNMESFPSSVDAQVLVHTVERVLMVLHERAVPDQVVPELAVPPRSSITGVRSRRSVTETVSKNVSLRAVMAAFMGGMVVCAMIMSRGARRQESLDEALAVSPTASQERSIIRRDNLARTCPEGMRFIRGGNFGGHWISGFCMDRTEVTVEVFCAGGKCESRAGGGDDCRVDPVARSSHPMNCVNWSEAKQYCEARGGRLPTEEQWEWGARGREEGRPYPWGKDEPTYERVVMARGEDRSLSCLSNIRRESRLEGEYFSMEQEARSIAYACAGFRAPPHNRLKNGASLMASSAFPSEVETRPVGSKPAGASRDGLLDMAGNVWEWTVSSRDEGMRVVRGGSWVNVGKNNFSTSVTLPLDPLERSDRVGFRCVQDPIMR